MTDREVFDAIVDAADAFQKKVAEIGGIRPDLEFDLPAEVWLRCHYVVAEAVYEAVRGLAAGGRPYAEVSGHFVETITTPAGPVINVGPRDRPRIRIRNAGGKRR